VLAVEKRGEVEKLHPGHHSIRPKEHDYSTAGFYFVTICASERKCIFGSFNEGHIELTALGKAARECWLVIPRHFAKVKLHEFVIMPSHLHAIVEIVVVGAQHPAPQLGTDSDERNLPLVKPGSLGTIIRSYKAAVTRQARRELGWHGDIWQRNYFERLLRDGKEIADAERYIAENPMMWELDQESPLKME
jgi:putative transposase